MSKFDDASQAPTDDENMTDDEVIGATDASTQRSDSNTADVTDVGSAGSVDLAQKVGDLTEALQRERADAMNLRRRHDEQIAALRSSTKAAVVRDLLPVIDNFERALKHTPESLEQLATQHQLEKSDAWQALRDGAKKYDDFAKGVQGIVKQFEDTLASIGVERIKTTGEPFDPHLHEAVSMEDGDGEQEVVSEELQAGYKVGDEVIRHAMVRVKTI